MSIVPKETIEVIAQSVGIPSLGADVAVALAPDVEYRLREIMQGEVAATAGGGTPHAAAGEAAASPQPALCTTLAFHAERHAVALPYHDHDIPAPPRKPKAAGRRCADPAFRGRRGPLLRVFATMLRQTLHSTTRMGLPLAERRNYCSFGDSIGRMARNEGVRSLWRRSSLMELSDAQVAR